MLEWPAPHCDPFRELLVHPHSLPYLNTQFGQGWRMDHSPFMITGTAGPDGENPAQGGGIHGATSAEPGNVRSNPAAPRRAPSLPAPVATN